MTFLLNGVDQMYYRNTPRMIKPDWLKFIIAAGIASILYVIVAIVVFFAPPKYTQVTDISKYGEYTGTRNDDAVQEFINAFFPAEIQPQFSNVVYSYNAVDQDEYAFEAYLEFTISDSDFFWEYISALAPSSQWQKFRYDEDYMEYLVIDGFELTYAGNLGTYENPAYSIRWAKIGRILYCEEDQSIIFSAIGVNNGGFANTSELSTFFDRFNIRPLQYARSAMTESEYYTAENDSE